MVKRTCKATSKAAALKKMSTYAPVRTKDRPDWAIPRLLLSSVFTGVFEKANKSPTMVVRRGAAPPPSVDDSSSSDEDDAFSAFGGKKKGKKKPTKAKKEHTKPNNQKDDDGEGNSAGAAASGGGTNAEDTSSNRRHHHVSSARQAKMDAMLKELQEAEQQQQSSGGPAAGHYGPAAGHRSGRLPPPDKKGSYCEPGTEHLTTNIFVGNLDPCTTEEELTEAFRQFGKNVSYLLRVIHDVCKPRIEVFPYCDKKVLTRVYESTLCDG